MTSDSATALQKFFASFFQKRSPFFLLLAFITTLPVALVHIAGLGDTLNHLARMHVLATIATSPELQRFYLVRWQPIPYLAMDALLPSLLHILPIYAAGRVFIAICLLLPVLAATALHRAIHHRASLIPAAAFLLSYNQLVSLGFLNYLFSASLAVLLFAGWVAAAGWSRWVRAAAFAPLVTLLYFGHVFACLAYCLSVAGWEGARFLRARHVLSRTVLADLAAAFAQAIPAMVFAATLDVGAGYVGKLQTISGGAMDKLGAILSPMLFARDPVNEVALLAALLVSAVLVRHVRLAPALWPAVVLLGLASLAMPHILASTGGTDLRLPMVTVLLLIGAASWRAVPAQRGAKFVMLATLLLLATAKSVDAWRILSRTDAQIAQTRLILEHLPRGSRLLVVNAPRGDPGTSISDPITLWHMPEVAIIDRDAFLPTLFTGLSTVHVRPPFRAASTPNGFPITPDQLREGLALSDQPGIDIADRPDGSGRLYHYGWPEKFDFVLVQRFGSDPGAMPANLIPVAHAVDMDLYRIKK